MTKGTTSNQSIPHEREAKLSVWPGFRMPELRESIPWVVTGEPREQVLDARYFDAADLRLIRLGITLRHRTGEGDDPGRWTLKLPAPSDGLELDRLEMEEVGPADAPPEHMVRAVKGVLRGAPLVPVAHLQTQRTVLPVHDAAQRPLGALDDDVVTAFEGEEVGLRFREVEFELAAAAPPQLMGAVVGALRAAGAGAPDHTPKLARALGPTAFAPADPAVPALSRDASTAVVFQNAVAGSVRRLLLHDPIIRLDAGEEGVHQARVATRRLRSDLRTFRPLLVAERVEPIRDELSWLGDLLGAVRDADVLRRRLVDEVDELDEEDRGAGGKLLAVLDAQRAPQLAALHEALDSPRYTALTEALVELALAPPLLAEAGEPARTALPKLAVKPWEHLERNIAGLPKQPSNEDLHRARILAKRARYAAEAASPILPAAGKHAAAIADLQGVLGDHQDAVVGEAWLRSVAREGCGGEEAFAAGLLVSREQSAASRYRGRWRTIWEDAKQKKLRAWLGA